LLLKRNLNILNRSAMVHMALFAVHTITKLKLNWQSRKFQRLFEDLIDAKRIVREIKLLKFFDHENVIALVDVQKPPAPTGYEDIYIVTDLMETDMHRVIYSRQDLTDDHL